MLALLVGAALRFSIASGAPGAWVLLVEILR
jgi:hypothetical protein